MSQTITYRYCGKAVNENKAKAIFAASAIAMGCSLAWAIQAFDAAKEQSSRGYAIRDDIEAATDGRLTMRHSNEEQS